MSHGHYYTLVSFAVRQASGSRRSASEEYLVHQLVADLFGDRDERGYLYRVLQTSPQETQVLVLSLGRPVESGSRPVRDWGWIISEASKAFDPPLKRGQVLDYEVRLNATRSQDQRRVDIWDAVWKADPADSRSPDDVYGEYLARRLGEAALVSQARVTERRFVQMRRGRHKEEPISLVSTNVAGRLEILEPEAFRAALLSGVGRSKAMGHGLICISAPGTVLPQSTGIRPEATR